MLQNINEYLERKLKRRFVLGIEFAIYSDILSVICPQEKLQEIIVYLNSDHEFRFSMLIDIFAVDYPELAERFEVNYCLLSVEKNYRVNIKVKAADGLALPTMSFLFKNAIWLEREVWDMHGVKFKDNPDLRRILTDYGFEGHPLRKDFPLTGYQEVRYDIVEEKVIYEPLNLIQEYRDFDFTSPWEGVDKVLPGDEKSSVDKKDRDGR